MHTLILFCDSFPPAASPPRHLPLACCYQGASIVWQFGSRFPCRCCETSAIPTFGTTRARSTLGSTHDTSSQSTCGCCVCKTWSFSSKKYSFPGANEEFAAGARKYWHWRERNEKKWPKLSFNYDRITPYQLTLIALTHLARRSNGWCDTCLQVLFTSRRAAAIAHRFTCRDTTCVPSSHQKLPSCVFAGVAPSKAARVRAVRALCRESGGVK